MGWSEESEVGVRGVGKSIVGRHAGKKAVNSFGWQGIPFSSSQRKFLTCYGWSNKFKYSNIRKNIWMI